METINVPVEVPGISSESSANEEIQTKICHCVRKDMQSRGDNYCRCQRKVFRARRRSRCKAGFEPAPVDNASDAEVNSVTVESETGIMGKRTETAYDESTGSRIEFQNQENGSVFFNGETSEDELDGKMMSTGLDESTSDSSDSGFQLGKRHPAKVELLGHIRSEADFDSLTLAELEAILDFYEVKYAKQSKKSECLRLVTDLWLSSAETSSSGSGSFAQNASLKDVLKIDDIDNFDAAALKALLVEHSIDYKESWSDLVLADKVKRLWAILNEDVDVSNDLKTNQSSPESINNRRSKSTTFSVHQITDSKRLPFFATEYSKFKFGSKVVAKEFGHKLADGLIELLKESPINQQIVVTASPYCFIPTATFAMKNYFVQRLNEFLVSENLPVVQETKIHRAVSYKGDYGALTAEERAELIGNESFHIDREFVKDKAIFFLDDIRITGSHEGVIRKMYQDYGLDNDHMFVYFAELVNDAIHPSIENELNFAFVKTLDNVDTIIKSGNFLLNTRVVKFILDADHDDFKRFILSQKPTMVWKIYHQAMGNSYHLIDEYAINFEFLRQLTK